jgi:hypothetical protein
LVWFGWLVVVSDCFCELQLQIPNTVWESVTEPAELDAQELISLFKDSSSKPATGNNGSSAGDSIPRTLHKGPLSQVSLFDPKRSQVRQIYLLLCGPSLLMKLCHRLWRSSVGR